MTTTFTTALEVAGAALGTAGTGPRTHPAEHEALGVAINALETALGTYGDIVTHDAAEFDAAGAAAAVSISSLGLDTDLSTFSVPASTTVSAFGASLVDDAAASDARTTLGLGTMATATESAYGLLAGRAGGQTLNGGTADTDTLTFLATAHGTPATGSDIIFKSGTTQLARIYKSGWNYFGPVASGYPLFSSAVTGIETNNNGSGSVYSSNSALGASFIGTEAYVNGCTIDLRNSAGTITSPVALSSGAVIGGMRIGSFGPSFGVDCAQIYAVTTENHGTTSGTKWQFYTCANTTTTKRVVATMDQDGSFTALTNIALTGSLTGATNVANLDGQTASSHVNYGNPITAPFKSVAFTGFAGSPVINFYRSQGTADSPTAVGTGQTIATFAFGGQYDSTLGDVAAGASITTLATENYAGAAGTPTALGTKIQFKTVPNTTATQRVVATMDQDGTFTALNNIVLAGTIAGATNVAMLDATATSAHVNYGNVLTGAFKTFAFSTIGAGSGTYSFYRAGGTAGSPTAVTSGQTLATLAFGGQYDTTAGDVGGSAGLIAVATENYAGSAGTPSTLGTKLQFRTIANTTTSPVVALTLDHDLTATFAGTVTLTDAKNIVCGSSTGNKIGTATTQKIGFYNATPVAQQASANQAAAPAGGTGATAGAYDTAGHRDSMIALVNEMRTVLVNLGLMKGSA